MRQPMSTKRRSPDAAGAVKIEIPLIRRSRLIKNAPCQPDSITRQSFKFSLRRRTDPAPPVHQHVARGQLDNESVARETKGHRSILLRTVTTPDVRLK